METDTKELLEQCMYPMLLVTNGTVAHTNHAAASRQIQVGMNITDLICVGKEEYSQFTQGRLCLTLCVNDLTYAASVVKTEKYDIFQLDSEYEDPTLRALALAAQQLRQPLANALLCADELSGSQEQLKQLNRSLYQMHRAICNMSDAAKYRAQQASRMENSDIAAFITEAVKKASAMVSAAGISICYTGPKQSVVGLIDAEKLERALLNLISNAVKFTSRGEAVTVSLMKKGSKLHLSVESQGTQIPAQARGNLFSRYLREPELEDGRWGIGLGLTIVRSAAIAHNGTLLLETTPNGQKFTMTLALAQSKDDIVRSHVRLPVEYTGGYDRTLVELSDILPVDLFD